MLSNCMRRSKCWAANVCTTINQPWCSGNKNDWIIHTRKRKEYASYYYLVKDSLNFMIYENSMHFTGGRSEMANLKYRYGRLICLPVLGSKVHAFWAVIQWTLNSIKNYTSRNEWLLNRMLQSVLHKHLRLPKLAALNESSWLVTHRFSYLGHQNCRTVCQLAGTIQCDWH